MAPVLQCPDCNTKHPIDVASDAAAFRCSGCGRTLKVPEQFRAVASLPPSAPSAGRDATITTERVAPSRNGQRTLSRRKVRAQAGVVPFPIRLAIWIVAVPLGFLIVFGFARVFGVLSSTQLEDVFLETGWDRFWPVARLLPFVALVTASIVHFTILYLSKWRVRHALRPLQPRPSRPAQQQQPMPSTGTDASR
jgi:hypothetical protein